MKWLTDSQAQKPLAITRFELAKRILVLLGLAGFLLLSLVLIRSEPRTGWSGVALFGLITVLACADLVRLRSRQSSYKRESRGFCQKGEPHTRPAGIQARLIVATRQNGAWQNV
ncbi:MAG TPA: hypothetical protein VF074_18050, partial [Pyrinomonadaceae bacterium]